MLLQVQYVEIGLFVTVSIAMVTLTVSGFVILISKVGSLRTDIATNIATLTSDLAVATKQNDTDDKNIGSLWKEVSELKKDRSNDVLQFTRSLGELNTTLNGINITLTNTNRVMSKMEQRLEEQGKEISELNNKIKG